MKKIFDRNLLKIHRDRAAVRIKDHDFLLKFAAENIIDSLSDVDFSPTTILEIGARYGELTQRLMSLYHHADIVACDLSQEMLKNNPSKNQILLDEEQIHNDALYTQKFDLIVSSMNMHWINDVSQFLRNISSMLSAEGIFVANFFGAGSLYMLRNILLKIEEQVGVGYRPHISPFIRSEDTYQLAQKAGFGFIVVDNQDIQVEYENIVKLMQDVRYMGESNALLSSTYPLPRAVFNISDSITETFNVITLIASNSNLKIRS